MLYEYLQFYSIYINFILLNTQMCYYETLKQVEETVI